LTGLATWRFGLAAACVCGWWHARPSRCFYHFDPLMFYSASVRPSVRSSVNLACRGGGICAAVRGLVDLFIPARVSAAEVFVSYFFFWECSVTLQSGSHDLFWMFMVLTCGRLSVGKGTGTALSFLLVFPVFPLLVFWFLFPPAWRCRSMNR
jgi:hypothetical protein